MGRRLGPASRDAEPAGASRRTSTEDEFAQVAAAAARATFAVFHDDPDSELYRASGLTPDETWRAITEQVAIIAADAAVEAVRRYNAVPQDVARWHRLIFERWFPEQAGRVRRGEEQGQYALIRRGAPGVALPDHDEQQWALGQALRPGGRHHSYDALAGLFERTIRASSSDGGTDKTMNKKAMNNEFSDYDGPTGLYIATGE